VIFLASCYNDLDLLRFFHENRANNTQNEVVQKTPLHFAAHYGHLCVVEYLVNQKADIKNIDMYEEKFTSYTACPVETIYSQEQLIDDQVFQMM